MTCLARQCDSTPCSYNMRAHFLWILTTLTAIVLPVTTSPVRFDDSNRLQERSRSLQRREEEARIFHLHALKKRKKKLLLHCLLNLQRSNPKALQGDPRVLFFNYVNLEYNQHGGGGSGQHGGGGGGAGNCLSHFPGVNLGGLLGSGNSDNDDDDDDDDDDNDDDGDSSGPSLPPGIGAGINNLGSLVGQAPGTLVSTVSEGVKPVFENSERYFNRYFVRPFYRSIRPFYRLF